MHRMLVGLVFWLCLEFSSAPVGAAPQPFDISAGPAEQAVRQLVNQARLVGVLYEPASLDGFQTRSLKGAYEWEEALRRLLHGSGLDFRESAPRLIFVHPVPRIPIKRRASQRNLTRSCVCVQIPQAAWCWQGDVIEYEPQCAHKLPSDSAQIREMK